MKLLLAFLFSISFVTGYSQPGKATADALVKMGFENVRWVEDSVECVYTIQNSAFRLEGVGISKAVDLIQKMGLPCRKPFVG